MRITPWLIFLLVSTTIAFIYPYLIHSFTKLDLPGNIGEFGDMYGVLNPVISALAFFGVMRTSSTEVRRGDLRVITVENALFTMRKSPISGVEAAAV